MERSTDSTVKTLDITIQQFYFDLCKKNSWKGEDGDFFHELAEITVNKMMTESLKPSEYIISWSQNAENVSCAAECRKMIKEMDSDSGQSYNPETLSRREMGNISNRIKSAYLNHSGKKFTIYAYDPKTLNTRHPENSLSFVINYKLSS